MYQINGIERTTAQLLAKQSTASDIATARIIAEHYCSCGLMARIRNEGGELVSEVHP